MGYIKAADVLPEELLSKIQDHVDGQYIYIPRKTENKKAWGETTGSKEETSKRNKKIYKKYRQGLPVCALSDLYCLSPKSLQKIIAKRKSTIR